MMNDDWNGSRPPYAVPGFTGRVVKHEFESMLCGDLLAYKVAGFAEHFDARILKTSPGCVHLQIGRKGLLPWSTGRKPLPIKLKLEFDSQRSNGLMHVAAELRPLAWQTSQTKRRRHYEDVLRELHAYLMRHNPSTDHFESAA